MRITYPAVLVTVLLALVLAVCAGAAGVVVWTAARLWPRPEPVAVTLAYEVDPESVPRSGDVDMNAVAAAVDRRLKIAGRLGRVEGVDGRRIRIGVFGGDLHAVRRVERLLGMSGTLEFRILANTRDHADLIDQAKKAEGVEVRDPQGRLLAWWVPVEAASEENFQHDDRIATRKGRRDGRQTLEVLVVKDPCDVDGRYLERAEPGIDRMGRPCIEFQLSSKGAALFGRLTGSNLPDELTGSASRLGIILDGRLRWAPNIQSTIFDRGEITGSFTSEEVADLVAILDAGTLPLRLRKVDRPAAEAGP